MKKFTEQVLIDLISAELPGNFAYEIDSDTLMNLKIVDTGIDSLSFFQVISDIDEMYEISIPENVISAEITFKELFIVIKDLVH